MLRKLPGVAWFAYLFFLALQLLATGMKTSFKTPLAAFLETHAEQFTELVSFVVGILGTALIQSSSSITSMSVVLVQEGVMPLAIAAGIVHGANLGTSVTSSLVAFATDTRPLTGHVGRDLRVLFFAPRGEGFERAVGAAVVHDSFNILLVTSLLLFLELPFAAILRTSEALAVDMESWMGRSDGALSLLAVLSPSTWTKPVAHALLDVGLPGWLLALVGLPMLLLALKGFSTRMRDLVMDGVDMDDLSGVGDRLLGAHPLDTFARGMLVTILVQSSSATTSMVVPLAAMGFFGVRRIFPFILGANVGTTTTALLAATGSLGEPSFTAGMTIALCHVLLNVLAVLVATFVPGVSRAVLFGAFTLARWTARTPAILVLYLFTLTVLVPGMVWFLPEVVALVVLGGSVIAWFVAAWRAPEPAEAVSPAAAPAPASRSAG